MVVLRIYITYKTIRSTIPHDKVHQYIVIIYAWNVIIHCMKL